MEAKVTRGARADQIDVEQFQEMADSPSFSLLRSRIRELLERKRAECEDKDDERGIHRAQGAVAALRAILTLPEQMVREMRAARTK